MLEQPIRYAKVPLDKYFVIFVDGSNFRTYTKKMKYEKPYDEEFNDLMVSIGSGFLWTSELKPSLVYIQSDELSLVFHKDNVEHGRRIVKLLSEASAFASAYASVYTGVITKLHSDIVICDDERDVLTHLFMRQLDAMKNFYLTITRHMLMKKENINISKAQKKLNGWDFEDQHDYLKRHNFELKDYPHWQHDGNLLFLMNYVKTGYNPIKKQTEDAVRRKVVEVTNIPSFVDFQDLDHLIGRVSKMAKQVGVYENDT